MVKLPTKNLDQGKEKKDGGERRLEKRTGRGFLLCEKFYDQIFKYLLHKGMYLFHRGVH